MALKDIKFKIEVDIPDLSMDHKIEDVEYFYSYNKAIEATASYAKLALNVPNAKYPLLQDKVKNAEYPELTLGLYTTDPSTSSSTIEKKDLILKRKFVITEIEAEQDGDSLHKDSQRGTLILVKMKLINPTLYELSNENGYNKILKNKSTKECIDDYLGFLQSTYGKTIAVKKVGYDKNENKFKHEEVNIKFGNDLLVLNGLLQNWKPWYTWGFQFFSDFVVEENSKNDITLYIINLGDKEFLEKKNLFDHGNEAINSRQLSDIPICFEKDKSVFKTDSNPTINYISTSSGKQVTSKTDGKSSVTTSSGKQEKTKSSMIEIYHTEEEPEDAQKRLEQTKDQIERYFESVVTYKIENSIPDVFQFGKRYNMNVMQQSDYAFTPLQIINGFTRYEETALVHGCNVTFLKFKGDDLNSPAKPAAGAGVSGIAGAASSAISKIASSLPAGGIPNAAAIKSQIMRQARASGIVPDLKEINNLTKGLTSKLNQAEGMLNSVKQEITSATNSVKNLVNEKANLVKQIASETDQAAKSVMQEALSKLDKKITSQQANLDSLKSKKDEVVGSFTDILKL
jgi:hypothetical protein